MPKDGRKTQKRILVETKQLVLENGFAGTSIDQILERTQLTKGSFFYHFKSKADLAMKLMEFFVQSDMDELEESLAESAERSDNPRSRLFAFVQRFIDSFEHLETPPPGCLYASYVNELEQFTPEIKDRMAEAILLWREALAGIIREVIKEHPPAMDVDPDAVADTFTVIFEGAYITSKALGDPKVMALQLIQYRNYLQLLFPE